jgi:hypothetical protein
MTTKHSTLEQSIRRLENREITETELWEAIKRFRKQSLRRLSWRQVLSGKVLIEM